MKITAFTPPTVPQELTADALQLTLGETLQRAIEAIAVGRVVLRAHDSDAHTDPINPLDPLILDAREAALKQLALAQIDLIELELPDSLKNWRSGSTSAKEMIAAIKEDHDSNWLRRAR